MDVVLTPATAGSGAAGGGGGGSRKWVVMMVIARDSDLSEGAEAQCQRNQVMVLRVRCPCAGTGQRGREPLRLRGGCR